MTEMVEVGGASRFVRLRTVRRWRAPLLIAMVALALVATACSSSGSANKPADSTTSTAAQTGAISNSAQQTVETWFSEVDAKNRTAPNLLEQPYRQDWIRTPDTSWPHFSDISCHAVSESGSAATVHCGFVESRFAGEVKPTTAWNVHLAKQPDGSWLIVRYGAT